MHFILVAPRDDCMFNIDIQIQLHSQGIYEYKLANILIKVFITEELRSGQSIKEWEPVSGFSAIRFISIHSSIITPESLRGAHFSC